MKFSKNLGWLKESDEDDNLLADDELDTVEEEMNEGLYVDPSNYDKHNDLVDVVDKQGNAQKMTQATYDKNKDSGEFEKKEPEENNDDDYYSDYYDDDDYYSDYYDDDDYYSDYYDDDETDREINRVNYANHPDYDDAYKYFVNNYLDSSNAAYKILYRTANGEYDPDELKQSDLREVSKVVDDLSNSKITDSIFYKRLKRASDYYNDNYNDYYDYYN